MKKIIYLSAGVALSLSMSMLVHASPNQTPSYDGLWYRQSTQDSFAKFLKAFPEIIGKNKNKELRPWHLALPIGNGSIGGMVYGEIEKEEIQFNEKTLWDGGPGADGYRFGIIEGASKNLPALKDHLIEHRKVDYKKDPKTPQEKRGRELFDSLGSRDKKTYARVFGCYKNFGSLLVETDHRKAECTDYLHGLDLDEGVVKTQYKRNDATFTREAFVSYVDRVLVNHWESSKPGSLNLTASLSIVDHDCSIQVAPDGTLVVQGKIESNNMAFEAHVKVVVEGGSVEGLKESIQISNANSVTFYLMASTDYRHEYPTYTGRDETLECQTAIKAIANKTYAAIRQAHVKDYTELYGRVALKIGDQPKAQKDVLDRVLEYKKTKSDTALEILYFNYGRYLLITSSRPGDLPGNLQGIWNDSNAPAWQSDYHFDVNLQMSYWPSWVCNLSECAEPLIEYIDKLRAPGRVAAKELYDIDKGWCIHVVGNPFGYVGRSSPTHGVAPTHGVWLSRSAWEHYAYSLDKDYLRNVGYPILKETAAFWEEHLHRDSDGTLVVVPSYAPEHGPITVGGIYDQSVVWDLFANCIESSEVLGVDEVLRAKWKKMQSELSPVLIGAHGQVKEWKDLKERPKDGHRHMNQLVSFAPGRQYSPSTSPEMAKAVETTMISRGDGATGWSIAWKSDLWARLYRGDRAHDLLKNLIALHTLPNLFDVVYSTPPFQIEANFGGTFAMVEMLMQSHMGFIHLLPALSSEWPEGQVTGLRARGGFEVDLYWKSGELDSAHIRSIKGGECVLHYQEKSAKFSTKKGEVIVMDKNLKRIK